MPCGGGSKHVLPRRAWLMTTSGSTGRRLKRRSTAIAMGKVVRSARDQVGATETANNRISIESDLGVSSKYDGCVNLLTRRTHTRRERSHPNHVDLPAAGFAERKLA